MNVTQTCLYDRVRSLRRDRCNHNLSANPSPQRNAFSRGDQGIRHSSRITNSPSAALRGLYAYVLMWMYQYFHVILLNVWLLLINMHQNNDIFNHWRTKQHTKISSARLSSQISERALSEFQNCWLWMNCVLSISNYSQAWSGISEHWVPMYRPYWDLMSWEQVIICWIWLDMDSTVHACFSLWHLAQCQQQMLLLPLFPQSILFRSNSLAFTGTMNGPMFPFIFRFSN